MKTIAENKLFFVGALLVAGLIALGQKIPSRVVAGSSPTSVASPTSGSAAPTSQNTSAPSSAQNTQTGSTQSPATQTAPLPPPPIVRHGDDGGGFDN